MTKTYDIVVVGAGVFGLVDCLASGAARPARSAGGRLRPGECAGEFGR